MTANLRDARRLHRALDAAAEELDLPLTSRQVRALAEATQVRLNAPVAGRRPKEHAADLLTPFEVDVLAAIAAGCENQQIAAGLSVPFGTVRDAVGRVLGKLGANGRAHAVTVGLLGGHVTAERIAAAPQPTKAQAAATFSEAV